VLILSCYLSSLYQDCGEPTISDLLRYNQHNRRSSYEPAPKKRRKR